MHGHARKRKQPIHHRLEMRGHGVGIQWKAKQQIIRLHQPVQQLVLVVALYAVAVATPHALKAAEARPDLPIDHMDDFRLLTALLHPLHKRARKHHGIADRLGTSVDDKQFPHG